MLFKSITCTNAGPARIITADTTKEQQREATFVRFSEQEYDLADFFAAKSR